MPAKIESRNRRKFRFPKGRMVAVIVAVAVLIIAVSAYVIYSPRLPVHDVAILQVVPDSAAVPQGQTIRINVTVGNQGTFAETFNVNASLPSGSTSQTFPQKITGLPAGADKILTFFWNTASLALGDYRINITLGQLPNETDVVDNSFSTTLTLSNKVLLATSMGNVVIELFNDMPITTSNFKNLTWIKVYDGTIFHRVVKGFVVQGGDPTGTGVGDPSISQIIDELPNKHSNLRGTVAMAKTDEPNSASSQFFINLNDTNAESLDVNYTVFGRVLSGMGVVDAIANVAVDTNSKPTVDVKVNKAEFIK